MNTIQKLGAASTLTFATLLAFASAAGADEVTDAVADVQSSLLGYVGPVAVGIAAIVAVWIGLPLIKRFARMLRNAVG